MNGGARRKQTRTKSSKTPKYRRWMRSIKPPPKKGMKSPGRVMTMTCPLTFTVECVAARMYQLTPAKFMPLPKSDTNMARKKKRKPRCAQISFQSTVLVEGVAMERISLLSYSRAERPAFRPGMATGDKFALL